MLHQLLFLTVQNPPAYKSPDLVLVSVLPLLVKVFSISQYDFMPPPLLKWIADGCIQQL